MNAPNNTSESVTTPHGVTIGVDASGLSAGLAKSKDAADSLADQVSKLPRGACPTCGRDVAVRRNGAVREHQVYLPQREQTPSRRMTTCPGSGQKAAS